MELLISFVIFVSTLATDSSCPKGDLLASENLVYKILDDMRNEDLQEQNIIVCVLENEVTKSFVETYPLGSGWAVVFTRHTLTTFSDGALKGAIAHEVGHMLINSRGEVGDQENERQDQQADAIAIRLVGAENLMATYVTHTGDKALAQRRIKRAMRILQLSENK